MGHLPSDIPTADAIERFLAGESTAAEARVVGAWLRDDAARQACADALKTLDGRADARADVQYAGKLWGRLTQQIGERATFAREASLRRKKSEKGVLLLGKNPLRSGLHSLSGILPLQPSTLRASVVSSLAILCALLGLSLVRRNTFVVSQVQARYQTGIGETATVHLADGSTLMLAPATTITIRSASIDVIGEAYFTVNSHETHPFAVTTRNTMVQVLGTRFAVRQYPGESRSQVVVTNGRVALRRLRVHGAGDERTVVSARMLAQVSDSGVLVQEGITLREYIGWTQGELVFDRTPLRDVVAALSRAYGADIRIADSLLADEQISAEVKIQRQPLPQVLDAIGLMMNAHIVGRRGTFTLVPGRTLRQESSKQLRQNSIPQPEKQYGR